jgi:hydroxymethylglutaryl-CoA reductase
MWSDDLTDSSRTPAFYKLSVPERVRAVHQRGLLSHDDYLSLATGRHTLNVNNADKMIENVIGVMGMPIGLALNFLVNGNPYAVPLVVEEPSIVAALSSAAKTVRQAGGFQAQSSEPLLIGQIQVVDLSNATKARQSLLQRKQEILNLANGLHPNMVARGGGARDVEVYVYPSNHGDMLVAHLLVDTCDAMGANLVNTMCEGVASLIESISEGKVFLRILSNLTDRALVSAEATIPVEHLQKKGFDGEQVRDGIIMAGEFASIDPYRATTHNKGIMNGVDAVAIATGNDWRAIEAAAHAYAARGNYYTSLSRWSKNDDGDLVGHIEIPMKVGTVGGPLQSNPTVALNHRILGNPNARRLAELMGAVGLAQNFAALRALVSEGIQEGHMTLHARSVATAAGATPEIFDTVVDRLVGCGEVKVWKAREIVADVMAESKPEKQNGNPQQVELPSGYGKAILFGEHAAVYGRHVVAAPISLAIQAQVETADDGIHLLIPRWGVEQQVKHGERAPQSFERPLALILDRFALSDRSFSIKVFPNIPRAMGLGGSAAMAVAIIRALDQHFQLDLADTEVNELAFECEKVAHGTPSGVDNTMATYGKFLLFKAGDPPLIEHLHINEPVSLIIAMTGVESLTAKMVAGVRQLWERNTSLCERIFDDIDSLTLQGVEALKQHDLQQLGDLMNVCHGLLNSLQVSSPEIEELISIARNSGAIGAKVTGGGGGGSIVAVCIDNTQQVIEAIRGAGYQAMEVQVG